MALEHVRIKMQPFDPQRILGQEGKVQLLELASNSLTVVPALVFHLGENLDCLPPLFQTF